VDKNAALEDEYRKVSAFKPLMESYKTQIATLETKNSAMSKEADALRFDLGRTEEKLRVAMEEREREGEAVLLYEERVRELELHSGAKKGPRSHRSSDADLDGGEHGSPEDVGGELDDALSGTTMTDLKIQVRKLKRDLEEARANKADASKIVVLENLLEDANRMKSRYEADYLREHREKLVALGHLEEIRSGKSGLGDGCVLGSAGALRLKPTPDMRSICRAGSQTRSRYCVETAS
jgi:protein HOOK3